MNTLSKNTIKAYVKIYYSNTDDHYITHAVQYNIRSKQIYRMAEKKIHRYMKIIIFYE